jgi:hypothetical protein
MNQSQHRSTAETPLVRWTASAIVLALLGVTLMGMGVYFVVLRPALLPEDLRYMGASMAQVEAAIPGMLIWLKRVFSVMGGYIFASGALMMFVAATSFRAHQPGAAATVFLAGLVSIAWMSAVNFIINFDFKWVLLGLALLWASALALFWIEASRHGPTGRNILQR